MNPQIIEQGMRKVLEGIGTEHLYPEVIGGARRHESVVRFQTAVE